MRGRSYRQLREEDRFIIYRMRKGAISQSEIAQALGFTQSTISKELKRNRGQKDYWAHEAQKKARERQKQKRHRGCVIRGQLERTVRERLERKHSPEQISGCLRRELRRSASTTSIYNYIKADRKNGGQLYKNLRINRKRSYRHHNKEQRPKMPARIGIEERPQAVERRKRYGDWEADLIAVSRGNLLSLYERKSRYGRLLKLPSKDSGKTAQAIIEVLHGYRVETITYDNGLEFAGHAKVDEALGASSYFCRPYHSWEKGGVENFNGLVRQYIPRGTNFLDLDEASLVQIETEINERPRKTLKFRSPANLKHFITT